MKRQNFNENWYYQKAGSKKREPVTLPHDAMIHDVRDANSPGTHANAFFHGGIYFYEKEFFAPYEWNGKHIELEFGGVYRNARIFVNDQEAGYHPYGYTPFTVCLNDFLQYGRSNTIRVEADNSKLPNSRWYSGGGIYRSVYLNVTEKTHIEWKGIHITTVSLNPARVRVQTDCNGGEAHIELRDGDRLIAKGKGNEVILTVPDAKLWNEDKPYLYSCYVSLWENGLLVDETEEKFGIREIKWSTSGLFINGRRTLLRGACIHHDNGVLGACSYREAEERRIRILKENGFNAVRMAHNPASEYLLEACDKYGMYVMDEAFDMWYMHKNKYDYAGDFTEWYREDLLAMVTQDYNHPSVIMYSIGNEVTEPYEPKGVQLAKEMVSYMHKLDASRPVTAGINLTILFLASKGIGMLQDSEEQPKKKKMPEKKKKEKASGSLFFNMLMSMIGGGLNQMTRLKRIDQVTAPILDSLDIAGYNYASGRYCLEKKAHPNRILVGSETFPQDIARNWAKVKKLPYLIGDFMWTGWDYIGEAAIGAWNYEGVNMSNVPYPWMLADVGAIDILGNPGAEAKYAAVVWGMDKKPFIGVRPINHPEAKIIKAVWRGTNAVASWSWKGCEGNRADIEIYADAAYVKLYLNGKLIGRKNIRSYKAVFQTRYVPGRLMVEAYNRHGKLIGSSTLCSADKTLQIQVRPEEDTARPGEIIYVNIELADRKGVVESNADRKLTISVENGELLGFGSANPRTEEYFDSGSYTTYYGRALAVIRCKDAGEVHVHVESDGLSGNTNIFVQ